MLKTFVNEWINVWLKGGLDIRSSLVSTLVYDSWKVTSQSIFVTVENGNKWSPKALLALNAVIWFLVSFRCSNSILSPTNRILNTLEMWENMLLAMNEIGFLKHSAQHSIWPLVSLSSLVAVETQVFAFFYSALLNCTWIYLRLLIYTRAIGPHKGEGEGENCERETLIICLSHKPWLGIEPTTFWYMRLMLFLCLDLSNLKIPTVTKNTNPHCPWGLWGPGHVGFFSSTN